MSTLNVCMYASIYLSIYPSIYLSIHLSIYLYICTYIHTSIWNAGGALGRNLAVSHCIIPSENPRMHIDTYMCTSPCTYICICRLPKTRGCISTHTYVPTFFFCIYRADGMVQRLTKYRDYARTQVLSMCMCVCVRLSACV